MTSTIGSNFFGLDKSFSTLGLDTGNPLLIVSEYIGAFSGGFVIATTRLPAIYKQVTEPRSTVEVKKKSKGHYVARVISVGFGMAGILSALNAGISAFLGGNTLAKHFKIQDAFVLNLFSYYSFICSMASFLSYSVIQSVNNSYRLVIHIIERKNADTQNFNKKTTSLLKTIIITSVCVTNSIAMFYFSTKNGLPLFLNATFQVTNINDKVIKTTAALATVPSEATYIFSQIASVQRFFDDKETIKDLARKKILN